MGSHGTGFQGAMGGHGIVEVVNPDMVMVMVARQDKNPPRFGGGGNPPGNVDQGPPGWIPAPPLQRLRIVPVIPPAPRTRPWLRIAQRGQVALLKSIPESLCNDIIASRDFSSITLFFLRGVSRLPTRRCCRESIIIAPAAGR